MASASLASDGALPTRPQPPSSFSDSQDALQPRPAPAPAHLHTHPATQTAALPFMHPTRAEFREHGAGADAGAPATWSSRASRKHRTARRPVHVVHAGPGTGADAEQGKPEGEPARVEQRLRNPGAHFKPRVDLDVSFWVAIFFTLGSVAWVVNGFYLLLPLLGIGESTYNAPAWWAFVGGTLFEVGAYLSLVESLNTGHDALFGPAVWALVSHDRQAQRGAVRNSDGSPRFRWMGLGDPRDIGYLANAIQMFAASIFWVSTIVGIPGVIPGMPTGPVVITNVFYWTPQVIGGTGFIVASVLLCLEVQRAWYRPALLSLGWHVGFWNLVGALGFTLCGAFGYAANNATWAEFQSTTSTFWGGWAFLIGSLAQLWEAVYREAPEPAPAPGAATGDAEKSRA